MLPEVKTSYDVLIFGVKIFIVGTRDREYTMAMIGHEHNAPPTLLTGS